MAKNALIALAASVAHDVGSSVRVNVIRYVESSFYSNSFILILHSMTGQFKIYLFYLIYSPGVTDGTRIFRYLPPIVRQTLIANTIAGSALGRPAIPMEMAKLIVFYCSDLATYMTGSNIEVIGGLSMKLL